MREQILLPFQQQQQPRQREKERERTTIEKICLDLQADQSCRAGRVSCSLVRNRLSLLLFELNELVVVAICIWWAQERAHRNINTHSLLWQRMDEKLFPKDSQKRQSVASHLPAAELEFKLKLKQAAS